MRPISGWHPGELSIHSLLNISSAVRPLYTHILGDLPDDQRDFYSDPLAVRFLPVTLLDETGRPWGSILSRANEPMQSFVSSPTGTTLIIHPQLWPGDPLSTNLERLRGSLKGESNLFAGLGIQFSTRKRYKFAGKITDISLKDKDGMDVMMDVEVNQTIGHCPKYINARSLYHHPDTHPKVVYNVPNNTGRLPAAVILFILNSDTVFVGSTYVAKSIDAMRFPSHVGMNIRGGKKGFMRVRKDGKTIVMPDYAGVRFYTTIGSIQATPLASLTFVSFTTGSVLYLTGDAINHVGASAAAIMPLLASELLTTIEVTGFVFVEDALPWRTKTNGPRNEEEVDVSPYSPPILLLAEEFSSITLESEKASNETVSLTAIELHSPDLGTFTWKVVLPADTRLDTVQSGQAVIMDMSALVPKNQYAQGIADERIRTWTMSSFQQPESDAGSISFVFTTTLRKKEGGAVTSALFSLAERNAVNTPSILAESKPLLVVGLRGIVGEFILPPLAVKENREKFLWVAGGVGITPFLAFLDFLVTFEQRHSTVDIVMVLATREPPVFLPLIDKRLNANLNTKAKISLVVHVYDSSKTLLSPPTEYTFGQPGPEVTASVVSHPGRLNASFFLENAVDFVDGRKVYLCGPITMEKVVVDAVGELVGTGKYAIDGKVIREGFTY